MGMKAGKLFWKPRALPLTPERPEEADPVKEMAVLHLPKFSQIDYIEMKIFRNSWKDHLMYQSLHQGFSGRPEIREEFHHLGILLQL